MKERIMEMINTYLSYYPEEQEKLNSFLAFVQNQEEDKLTNWNNTEGHITAGAFVYAKKEKQFLTLYHKDLKMYLYPGGHMEKNDTDPLYTAKRELAEETGISKVEIAFLKKDSNVPIDIDIHRIPNNANIPMPEHIHFDFRYLFMIDTICKVKMDEKEISTYQWSSIEYLRKDSNFKEIIHKIEKMIETKGEQ